MGKRLEITDGLKVHRKDRVITILWWKQYLNFCLDVGERFYIMGSGPIQH